MHAPLMSVLSILRTMGIVPAGTDLPIFMLESPVGRRGCHGLAIQRNSPGWSRRHEKVLVAPSCLRNMLSLVWLDHCAVKLGPSGRCSSQFESTQRLRSSLAGTSVWILSSAAVSSGSTGTATGRPSNRTGGALSTAGSASRSSCSSSRHDVDNDSGRRIRGRSGKWSSELSRQLPAGYCRTAAAGSPSSPSVRSQL